MPRVAIIFEYPTMYGGERSMLAAIDAMDRSDLEIVAIAPKGGLLSEAISERGLRHVPLQLFDEHTQRLPREQILPLLEQAIERAQPDVVHANSLAMGVLTGLLQLPVPRIAHLRDIMRVSKNVMRLLNRNDLLIAVSNATRNYHIANGLDKLKTRVIYNGVDPASFAPTTCKDELRNELKLNDDALLALTVGQIGLRKGLDVLIDAVCLVAKRLPQLHFAIAGERSSNKPESVEFEQQLKVTLRASDLSHRVHWLGYRTDVPHLMQQADLLVHAAKQEPLGRVLLEAAAARLPIVATDVGGTSEIVENNVSARLVPAGDPNELAIGIWEVTSNLELRSRFAAGAYKRAQTVFSPASTATELSQAWHLFILD